MKGFVGYSPKITHKDLSIFLVLEIALFLSLYGYNFCLVRLFEGFNVWIALCDDCLEKLKKVI
jgi:hypothetical protein